VKVLLDQNLYRRLRKHLGPREVFTRAISEASNVLVTQRRLAILVKL
jgi:hypothetical protein